MCAEVVDISDLIFRLCPGPGPLTEIMYGWMPEPERPFSD